MENFLAKMRADVYPRLKGERGIRRMYLLRSAGGGNEFVALTLWNSKSEADAYGAASYQKNIQLIRDLLESDPFVTEYDVEFHDVNSEDIPIPERAKQLLKRSRNLKKRKVKPKRKTKKRRSR